MNRRQLFSAAALFGAAVPGFAQEVKRERSVSHSESIVVSGSGAGTAFSGGPGTFAFVTASAEAGKTVTGAPYSADAASETTRILSDGTRIVNRNNTSMARDKDGRTRREVSVANIGPWSNSNSEAPRFVTITDPVSKEVLVLNLNERTASKSKFGEPQIFRSEMRSGDRSETKEARVHVSGSSSSGVIGGIVGRRSAGKDEVFVGTPGVPVPPPAAGAQMMWHRLDSRNSQKEPLGKKMIEGVMAEGTRVTNTIPAGEIGNDRPIVSTEESWYSPDLQMVIYSKNVDPQFGETEYRVTNIRRTEPDANLFKAPADFKVLDRKELIEMKPMIRKMKSGDTI
ncbi:MAG: hypothetical protein HY820_05150 [Acidobacteria bacterium]|nr:hypothetical protein [Acidobacteriota bacterium]